MAETAVDPPPTTEAYVERLRAWHASIVADLDSRLRYQVEIVEKNLVSKEAGDSGAAAAAALEVSRVRSEDVAVLDELEETGREFTRELSKKVRGQLGEVVSRHAKIDVGLLNEMGIGEVIRSFRSVSPETTQQALSDFISGASNGDDFRLCLKAGADVNGLVEGQTSLIRSVCANHMEAFQMILEDGADLEAKAGKMVGNERNDESDDKSDDVIESDVIAGDTALTAASRLRRWAMVRSLVAEGANADALGGDGNKALQIACEAAEKELDTEADLPDSLCRLHYDPQNGDPAVRSAVSAALKDLLEKTSGVADLKVSARRYFSRESLVHFFAWHEFQELLLLSLSRGVDVDATDRADWTALMAVAARARPEFVKILVENGADVTKAVNESPTNTALHIAVSELERGKVPHTREESFISSVRTVVEILLDRGADVNTQNNFDETALHSAVQSVLWGVTEIVRFLVERGANLQVQDDEGNTPHDLAVMLSRSPELCTLLAPPTAAE
uniref:Uncharacterized protein n=1 Tax=Chromera velia CCMP2878 TaxID=1169474 RepID=A0A0G4ICA9_9ALVE|eukprot:Cvel_13086.t1-p1 / transcript=Cvel_13086.t1 / gene=Cvel_13086 / organism=Chromera_velia_CCMP2878 / gene_product=26S proteasome non-ATPase regulatory subunit 10, putative / transcript_product=26S proteasome non-ATPase regulatory subunit 10, putative / location=Cvel_scaffold881:37210-38721(+) / protein_length=504 / sequence_SO=supercontig / SO=protein_coding / is_pseudo=false